MADRDARRSLSQLLRVEPGSRIDLDRFDAQRTHGWKREDAELHQAEQEARLTELQERLWAEGKRSLLIVLQGIDAAGKDGTIRKVMDAFNPQGCTVTGFKVPSSEELRHDYLWRIHHHTPGKGSVAIFNRSHYEDVLIVRVHGLVPRDVWRRRYRQINDWERLLTEEGTVIRKFFLYIDRDEQRERLQARIDDPNKRWKFSASDLPEREKWDSYRKAFEDMLEKTSTKDAPWYLIPANRKWFRNLAVSTVLAETLTAMDPRYPPADPGIEDIVIPR
ncbi:MAG: polyphosphate kinase 2 family protein [Chloroflexi bacterium]|nr:polyphosphate kinase 2 family protein [Chloroflexota bacterium]